MSVKVKYKGNEIADINTSTTKTLKTSGKYCEGDIELINTQDGGGGSSTTIVPLNVKENGTYTAPSDTAYTPVKVEVPRGTKNTFGNHVNENGKWIKPDDWDDIESIDIGNRHECYLLCGTKLNDYPFVKVRVYGGDTIKWSYGHVSNGVYTIHENSTEQTIQSASYIKLDLSDIEDEYIVIRITANNYLMQVTPNGTASTETPASRTAVMNCILWRYARFYRANALSLGGCVYLECDTIIDFAKQYENTSTSVAISNAYSSCSNLQKVNLINVDFSKLKIATAGSIFSGCNSLSEIATSKNGDTFDMTGLTKGQCTSIASMFNGCYSLKSKINVSNWDLANCTNMSNVFGSNKNLETIIGLDTWTNCIDTTTVNSIFYNCYSLRGDIDCSSWDLGKNKKLKDVSSFFYGCISLDKIKLDNSDFSEATTISNCFYQCGAKEIDFGDNFIPPSSKCTNFSGLFNNSCVKYVDISNWDLSGSTSTYITQLFYSCLSIEEIKADNVIFNRTVAWADGTGSSTSFIRYCYRLKKADFSWFDMSICTGTSIHLYGFRECYNLVDFYPPKNICKKFDVSVNYSLSRESLIRILNSLKTVTTTTQLVLGTINLTKLTDDEKAIATGKGWSLS